MMSIPPTFESTHIGQAELLDSEDVLSHFRSKFVIDDPNLIYLDGNSLGRLSSDCEPYLQDVIKQQWGQRLIRSWNEGWMETSTSLGVKIARLIGAHEDEVLVCDSTSVNLFKLTIAALRASPGRSKVVSDVFNFPSDLYITQGAIELLDQDHHLELIPSTDDVHISPGAVDKAIDEHTALVSLSHVAFKSSFMYDMQHVTSQAHKSGAFMLWDLSHSTGAVPVDLKGSNVDLAIGCTYKYLNGGPGSPAFLYVRRDLQSKLIPPIWGWFASRKPFDFDLDFFPATDIKRFQISTPPVLSMKALEPALDLILVAGIDQLRRKSIQQTEYLIFLADNLLRPLGFELGSSREPDKRGSHISLRHEHGYRITRALIESPSPAIRVIPDFREPDNIRLGIAPLYNTFLEIYLAVDRLRTIVTNKLYEDYPSDRLMVT